MPCEDCHTQFTVFRRKRSCSDCKRFYCSNCLNSAKRSESLSTYLCRRCSIFAKRPLLRSDLMKLKPKDLIFYLQSKQISIAGCVEKDELISLVLSHVEQADTFRHNGSNHTGTNASGKIDNESANSFDGIKQTCQNFFTNLTDNISETFANFDARKPQQQHRQNDSSCRSPTVEQPRVYFREMPSYASAQARMGMENNTDTASSINNNNIQSNTSQNNHSNSNNYQSSPSFSVSSASSAHESNNDLPAEAMSSSTLPTDPSRKDFDLKSDCECSDDEIMLNFSERHSLKTEPNKKTNQSTFDPIGPSTSNNSVGLSKAGSQSSKLDVFENNSQSSFEELGAIGGNSDEIIAISSSPTSIPINENETTNAERPTPEVDHISTTDFPTVSTLSTSQEDQQETSQIPKTSDEKQVLKVVRRRSDSYLTRHRNMSVEISPTSPSTLRRPEISLLPLTREQNSIEEQDEPTVSRPRLSCTRCGRNKSNLRRHVERMRRHLQSSQLSDEEIKREMNEFLEYLENRQKSMDHSDNDTVHSSISGVYANQLTLGSPSEERDVFDDNEGINVYASEGGDENGESRFIKINEFQDINDLELLSVKELKEILMLHRVDYKGCCEKQELLERVQRLWKHLKAAPKVDKLPSDEICKICMDAPIECVILECGHMATCTRCGKVLSECPICRQYIVRVVRFFRA